MRASPPQSFANRGTRLQQVLGQVEACIRAGDMVRAAQLAGDAVANGHEHINLLVLAAYDQLTRGAPDKALAFAIRARELSPHNADALNVLGLSLARLNRPREALPVYDAALRQAPDAAHLHFNKGCTLEELNEVARARSEFERTIDLQPAHSEALARLASLGGLRGDVSAARNYASRSLQHDPHGTVAPLALALAHIEEKKFDDALVMLSPVAREGNRSVVNRSIALGLTGDALDGLGRTAEAFTAYSQSKAVLRALYRPMYEAPGLETAEQRIQRLMGYFQGGSQTRWRGDRHADPDSRVHVFLVGFPRSGTTLLEQILDSHPDVESMPERDCLLDAATDFVLSNEGLGRLATLDQAGLDAYRKKYWSRVAHHGQTAARKVFIDKMPLNTVLLCLIAKLFPDAKVILALRDPRDVVFSCFRRRFGLTPQMYELLSLDGAAHYYCGVMGLVEIYREKLNLDLYELHYEATIADFDREIRSLCAFLGLEWNDSVRDFATRARAADINTPSSAQVARGLYAHGAAQWRRYEAHLQGILPLLAPWVSRFG